MSAPPPLWFRSLLVAAGAGFVAYQRLLPEPIATLKASPLAALLVERPLLTPPGIDAWLMAAVPVLVGAVLAWTARARRLGPATLLWRFLAGSVSSLLVLVWCGFFVPTMLPTSIVLLVGAAASAWGLRFPQLDTGGMGAILVVVAATVTCHFLMPLTTIAAGAPAPLVGGGLVSLALWLAMRARPFDWHAPPAVARGFAAVCCFGFVAPILGHFSVDGSAYGCQPPDPADCPYDDPALTWLERDSDAVYYGVHLDAPRDQVIALARARYCEDGTTATAAFFGLDGTEHARVPIPDCDRAYAAGRPDDDRLLPVCASGLQQLDLENRTLTTPPLERFSDFEVETAIEREDGSWWVSGVDQAVVARYDGGTLQETNRWWAADAVHVVTRLEDLDFLEPGLFLHQSTTAVQVLDKDFNLRARRRNFGANVFPSVDPLRSRLYVPDTVLRRLRVWTLPDLEPVADVPINNGAYVAYHSPELGLQAISNFGGHTVDLYDADSLERLHTLDVGPGPRGGAFDPRSGRLIGTSRCGLWSVDVSTLRSAH